MYDIYSMYGVYSMKNLLATLSVETFGLLIDYGFYLLIILISFILIGVFKKKDKKRLDAEEVRTLCVCARNFAVKQQKKKHSKHVIASPQLSKLASFVAEPAWLAFRMVEEKRDIDFNGIVTDLDALATKISEKSLESFLLKEEYEGFIAEVIELLDLTIQKLDGLLLLRRKG